MAAHGIWKWMLQLLQGFGGEHYGCPWDLEVDAGSGSELDAAAPYGIWGEHCSCWWGLEEDAVDPCGT